MFGYNHPNEALMPKERVQRMFPREDQSIRRRHLLKSNSKSSRPRRPYTRLAIHMQYPRWIDWSNFWWFEEVMIPQSKTHLKSQYFQSNPNDNAFSSSSSSKVQLGRTKMKAVVADFVAMWMSKKCRKISFLLSSCWVSRKRFAVRDYTSVALSLPSAPAPKRAWPEGETKRTT